MSRPKKVKKKKKKHRCKDFEVQKSGQSVDQICKKSVYETGNGKMCHSKNSLTTDLELCSIPQALLCRCRLSFGANYFVVLHYIFYIFCYFRETTVSER